MTHRSANLCANSCRSSLASPLAKLALALTALAALTTSACDSPDKYLPFPEFGGPAGVLKGTLTYAGPMPCTKGGRVVGAAILLAFDVRLLPPPEGLGTSAASLGVVPGETLFAGVKDELEYDPDGDLHCPKHRYFIGSTPIPLATVSADWALAPLAAGTYQVRGFYDLDGDFDPGFLISNLPTKGDIGGGAIENASAVLKGYAPRFRELSLGDLQDDGSRVIGEQGDIIEGIAVTLGLELPLDRPVFYPTQVLDTFEGNKDPNAVVMRSDFQLNSFSMNPFTTEESFIKIRLGTGVDPEEAKDAAQSPFLLPVDPPAPFIFTQQDVNGDGKLNAEDHVPESEQVPALYPLSIFSKLVTGSDLVNQPRPTVVLQGLTLFNGLLGTVGLTPMPGGKPILAANPEVTVALRPAALCLDALQPTKPGLLVVSHETDTMGNPILPDPEGLKKSLAVQFKRPIEIAFGCLPEGRYAMNLIYSTGQAWTVPNEAAICSHLEEPKDDGKTCGTRPRLASQGAVLTIGPPKDAAYCASAPGVAAINAACYGK
jgi:hypothetical protein